MRLVLHTGPHLYVSALNIASSKSPLTSRQDYLAVYYEAVELASPVGTGVDTFASSGILMPFGIIAGISITKTGKYKPQLAASWVCIIVGSALLSTVGLNTPRSRVLGYQALYSIGLGPLVTSLVFPILAPLPVSLNASALAFYAFARYFLQVRPVSPTDQLT